MIVRRQRWQAPHYTSERNERAMLATVRGSIKAGRLIPGARIVQLLRDMRTGKVLHVWE